MRARLFVVVVCAIVLVLSVVAAITLDPKAVTISKPGDLGFVLGVLIVASSAGICFSFDLGG